MYYHGLFDNFLEFIDIYGICLAFSMFAFLWLSISALYTIIFQFYINKWNEYELLFNRTNISILLTIILLPINNRTRHLVERIQVSYEQEKSGCDRE